MNRLLGINDVAELLKVNRNTVYDLIKHGQLRPLKLGRLKITTIELDSFLERNTGKDLTDLTNVKDWEGFQ